MSAGNAPGARAAPPPPFPPAVSAMLCREARRALWCGAAGLELPDLEQEAALFVLALGPDALGLDLGRLTMRVRGALFRLAERARRNPPAELPAELIDPRPGPEASAAAAEVLPLARAALSPRQAAVLEGTAAGESDALMSVALGCTVPMIQRERSRAVARLRRHFA